MLQRHSQKRYLQSILQNLILNTEQKPFSDLNVNICTLEDKNEVRSDKLQGEQVLHNTCLFDRTVYNTK